MLHGDIELSAPDPAFLVGVRLGETVGDEVELPTRRPRSPQQKVSRPDRLGRVREGAGPTLPQLDQVEDLDVVVEREHVDRGVGVPPPDRHVEREKGLLRGIELPFLRHAAGTVEREHDVDPLARDLPEDVARRLVDVPRTGEPRREQRAGDVKMGDLLRAAQAGLLVDAGRAAAPKGHADVTGKASALLLEQEPREPLDEAVGDRELPVMLGDEPPLLELALEPVPFRLADAGLGLRLGPPLGFRALFLEPTALGLCLAPLLLGLLLDPAFPRFEGSRHVVAELLALRAGELGERVPELGRPDRAAVGRRGGEDHAPPAGRRGGGRPSAREQTLEPREEAGEGGAQARKDPGRRRALRTSSSRSTGGRRDQSTARAFLRRSSSSAIWRATSSSERCRVPSSATTCWSYSSMTRSIRRRPWRRRRSRRRSSRSR